MGIAGGYGVARRRRWHPIDSSSLLVCAAQAPCARPNPIPGQAPSGLHVRAPSGGSAPPPAAYVEEKITIPTFGRVRVYRPEPLRRARGVVLFVSGDGGWKLGV